MATKTKLEKKRQELIEKYGDIKMIEIVDYYYPEITFTKTGETRRNVCHEVKLSQVAIDNTGDLKNVERALISKNLPIVRMIKFKESEDLFFSKKEIERRKKYLEETKNIYQRHTDIKLPMLIKDTVHVPDDLHQSGNHPSTQNQEEQI